MPPPPVCQALLLSFQVSEPGSPGAGITYLRQASLPVAASRATMKSHQNGGRRKGFRKKMGWVSDRARRAPWDQLALARTSQVQPQSHGHCHPGFKWSLRSFSPIRYQPRLHVGIATPRTPGAAPPLSRRGSIGNGVEGPCISYEEIDLRQEFTPRSREL